MQPLQIKSYVKESRTQEGTDQDWRKASELADIPEAERFY
jgi:hypothetical protein